jgi:hypothetical protein
VFHTTQVEVLTGIPPGRWDLAVITNGVASPSREIQIV